MRRVARNAFNALAVGSMLLIVGVVSLWLATRHSSVILRRQASGHFDRVVFNRGALAISFQRWPTAPSKAYGAGMYDVHAGSCWSLPQEWVSTPSAGLGVRAGSTVDGEAVERFCVVPLWITLLPPTVIVGCWLVWRGGDRRPIAPLRGVGRYARGIFGVACVAIGLLWVHSLCFRGWELDLFCLPFGLECDRPGAVVVRTYLDPSPVRTGAGDLDPEWSGWVCRLIAPYSIRTQRGSDTPSEWRAFPGFHGEAVIETSPFVGVRRDWWGTTGLCLTGRYSSSPPWSRRLLLPPRGGDVWSRAGAGRRTAVRRVGMICGRRRSGVRNAGRQRRGRASVVKTRGLADRLLGRPARREIV
jgi:hypothetical protein